MISPSLFFFHFFQISFFGLLEGGQRGKMTQNDKRLCSLCLISQELYIIWSSFMVHISCFFSHFSQILIFRVNSGVKGQKKKKKKKRAQKYKNSVMLHISGTIHHMIIIYGTLMENDNISRSFFLFFKILIFWVVRGVKGQKMAQNEKKLCLSCSISQEPYIIWFSFMVHLCKMIISPGVFFFFSKSWFSGLLKGVKGQKIVQNVKKFCLLRSISQGPYIIWSSFVVRKCRMMISPGGFFMFFKILIFQIFRRVKGEKMAQHNKKNCPSYLYISGTYIIWSSFMIRMCKRIILSGFFYIFSKF